MLLAPIHGHHALRLKWSKVLPYVSHALSFFYGMQKKKIWEAVQPLLKTDGDCVAGFNGRVMLTSAGPVTAATLAGASIS